MRFHYVSTCYVSGRYSGVFGEEDLEKGQTFNNFYEETKYHAEVEVQKRMKNGFPATVYRPAIVVGDSHTGATQKFDGPYYVIRWLLKQPYVAIMPMVVVVPINLNAGLIGQGGAAQVPPTSAGFLFDAAPFEEEIRRNHALLALAEADLLKAGEDLKLQGLQNTEELQAARLRVEDLDG